MLATDDTICAIASARGGAARGVVRVTGPKAIDAVATCFAANDAEVSLHAIRRATAIDGMLRVDSPADRSVDLRWRNRRPRNRS